MINFSVLRTRQSTISLEGLWEVALPEVIAQLSQSGYTVNEDDMAQEVAAHGFLHKYRLEPGPATLTAVTDNTGDGSIQFALTGPKFGMRFGTEEADPVLWMRLVALGVKFGEPTSSSPASLTPTL
jgi:hypothetical protein